MGRRRIRVVQEAGRGVICLLGLVVLLTVALGSPSVATPAGLRGSPIRLASVLNNTTTLSLSIGVNPYEICSGGVVDCPVHTATARVTLTAQAGAGTVASWPAVQLLFVIETSPYDGVYDPSAEIPGADTCGDAELGVSTLCEESNGVPFFVANAKTIAQSIAAAHPSTNVTFGLVDYFSTRDLFDDGDGSFYHVDVGQFLSAPAFGAAVPLDFQRPVLQNNYILAGSDLADNFLHSSSITALYGALRGAAVDWTPTSHHVIVWIGSTAPRDPGYRENYCVSPGVTPKGLTNCVPPTCEPPNLLPGGFFVPNCEGWVRSSTGNQSQSIAALAAQSRPCVESYGENCTIDTIDLYTTPTDPTSLAWSASGGSGSPANWTQDATSILAAGCDMAVATGGTWNGPTWYSCQGAHGTLGFVAHGPAVRPNTANPTLGQAILDAGFGYPDAAYLALGASAKPFFEFVPWGAITLAALPNFNETCANLSGAPFPCPGPEAIPIGSTGALGWNISANPFANGLRFGDTWSARFDVIATGPPFGIVPVDACITFTCSQVGSGAILGNFTSTHFRAFGTSVISIVSFDAGLLNVFPSLEALGAPPPLAPGLGGPPPPPGGGGPAPGTPPATPVSPILSAIPTAVQAITAGTIAAGLIRMAVRGRPVSVATATQSGAFGTHPYKPPPHPVGRWV